MADKKQEQYQAKIPITTEFEQMLISAERYACGRRTYIVTDTVDYITELLPALSDWCIKNILRDMEVNLEMEKRIPKKSELFWGDKTDRETWMWFIDDCRAELKKRQKKRELQEEDCKPES